MIIRKTKSEEIPILSEIYEKARKFMSENGNPHQWCDNSWPPESLLFEDVLSGRSFVVEDNGKIVGTFCYIFGLEDETYKVIENGKWSKDERYGVVHRLASIKKGVGTFVLTWAFKKSEYLRIDTHPDNIPMQRLLDKLGFNKCGIIHVFEDDYPRLAYDK